MKNMHLCTVVACCLWISISSCVLCSQMPDDWIDPLDPIAYDPAKTERDYEKYQQAKSQQADVADHEEPDLSHDDATDEHLVNYPNECTCDSEKDEIRKLHEVIQTQPACETEYFKQHVARLVSRLLTARLDTTSDVSHFQISVSLSSGDLKKLDDFAKGSAHVADAHTVLNDMLKSFKQVNILEESYTDWLQWIRYISLVVFTTVLMLHAIRLQWQSAIPWTRILGSIFVIMFLISVGWNWYHLYQKAVAKQMAKLQGSPGCNPKEMSFFSYILSAFSFEDPCVEYYQNMYVEPWTEVPITKATAMTLTKFLLEPLEHIGEAVSKMILACVKNLPLQLQAVSLCLTLVAFILVLMMAFGYKIRLFHFFQLEPSRPSSEGINQRQLVRELTSAVHQDLESLINDRTAQILQSSTPESESLQTREVIHNRPVLEARLSDGINESKSRPDAPGITERERQAAQSAGDDSGHDFRSISPEEHSISVVSASKDLTKPGHARSRKKKQQPVRANWDSSIAAQCGHSRKEDRFILKSQQVFAEDLHPERIDTSLVSDSLARHDKDVAVASANAARTSSSLGFDPLARDLSSVSAPSQSEVEDVGSQEGKRSSLRPSESSDDSDLEIIEEEQENIQS